MQVDMDAGTLKFWVDSKPHGSGYTSGVTGPLRWATTEYYRIITHAILWGQLTGNGQALFKNDTCEEGTVKNRKDSTVRILHAENVPAHKIVTEELRISNETIMRFSE